MSGDVIQLRDELHDEVLRLLPWFATGRLEAGDQLLVETHLAACSECQAELRFERDLHAEVAHLPLALETGWARLRGRLETASPRRRTGNWLLSRWPVISPGPVWSPGAVLALAAAVVVAAAAIILATPPRAVRYVALGSPRLAAAGNAVVIFRADAREADLRAALLASHARLVDGPTAADAYVIRVPNGERSADLAKLQARPDVELAEPVDAGASP